MDSSLLDPIRKEIYKAKVRLHGQAFADRLGESWEKPDAPEPLLLFNSPYPSHRMATALLEPHRDSLGAAYPTLHLLARWSIENATSDDPAPHLMTTYWTLEEALGQSERNIRRHLTEDGHPWSDTVRTFIDIRHNYGTMLDGKDDLGQDKTGQNQRRHRRHGHLLLPKESAVPERSCQALG